MAKTKISEWSTTPASNTDIDGINIAEGCAPSGINDAIRDLMSQVRSWQSGASGDPFNGPMNGTIGATTAYSGAFTTLSASGTTTLSGLTASTALALDASKNVVSVTNTGSGSNVLATSPTLVTPALGTPSSATLTNATGLPISTGVSGLGTGVATALAVNVGSAGAPVVNGGALGTPSSGTVTNLTGTASININGTVGATTPTTGAFTTLAASSSVTLSGGTANGVLYLNGSKVATSGSALTFDGTTLGLTNTSTSANNTTTGSFLTGGTLSFRSRGASAGIGGNTYSNQIISNNGTYVDLEMYTIGTLTNLVFGINATEGMRLTSTGLGIGTSSPSTYSAKLAVVGTSYFAGGASSTEQARFGYTDGTSYWGMGRDNVTTGNFILNNAGTTVATFSTAGNLGLGVTPSAWGTTPKALQVGAVSSFVGAGLTFGTNVGYNYFTDNLSDKYIQTGFASVYNQRSGEHRWYTAPSGTAGNTISFTQAMTLDASGNLGIGTTSPSTKLQVNDTITIGTADKAIQWLNSGTALADIRADSSSNIIFRNTSSYTERARIDSSGNLLVGKTSTAIGTAGVLITNYGTVQSSTATGDYSIFNKTTTTTGKQIEFRSGNTAVGYIESTSTATSYNTSSDYRLKNTIAPMTGALAKVAQLKPVTYKWNADGSDGEGFIAHELAEVCPHAVSGEKDAVDEEGNPKYQGIDTSFLVATLTAAIQEQQAIIESLKARLDAANL